MFHPENLSGMDRRRLYGKQGSSEIFMTIKWEVVDLFMEHIRRVVMDGGDLML